MSYVICILPVTIVFRMAGSSLRIMSDCHRPITNAAPGKSRTEVAHFLFRCFGITYAFLLIDYEAFLYLIKNFLRNDHRGNLSEWDFFFWWPFHDLMFLQLPSFVFTSF